MPRLERMVNSRNLSTFEKNIILMLIGAVIQPNKVIFIVYACCHKITVNLQNQTIKINNFNFLSSFSLMKFVSQLKEQALVNCFVSSAPTLRQKLLIVNTSTSLQHW